MTLNAGEIGLYLIALFLLFLTPGPVWVALVARCLQNGFFGGLYLALGVVVGDIIWPIAALLTLNQVSAFHADILYWLKYIAVSVFFVMGIGLLRANVNTLTTSPTLTRPGFLSGFIAGVLVIIGNPKAILFYIGILPGFFDVARLTMVDIVVIGLLSATVPFLGNVVLSYLLDHASTILNSPRTRQRLNQSTGIVLIVVGFVILVS